MGVIWNAYNGWGQWKPCKGWGNEHREAGVIKNSVFGKVATGFWLIVVRRTERLMKQFRSIVGSLMAIVAPIAVGAGEVRIDPLGELSNNYEFDSCLDSRRTRVQSEYGRRGDGWPRSITGTGIVRAIQSFNYSGIHMIIEVVDVDRAYPAESLYAYAYRQSRFGRDLANYCNKLVSFSATKIYRNKRPKKLTTSFDSGGIPFYLISDFHVDSNSEIDGSESTAGDGRLTTH